MRNIFLCAAAAASLLGAGLVAGVAQAEPAGQLIIAVQHSGDPVALQDAQFVYLGRNFCWYTDGWQGPGFYWCGYAWRRGYGWGGGYGWNGWRGGYANGWRGGPGGGRGYGHGGYRHGGHYGGRGAGHGNRGAHGRGAGGDDRHPH